MSFQRPITAVLLCASPLLAAEPFPVRGWDIERPDPPYVIDQIHKAHAAGMNTISLSHEVVMNAEEILWDWHRYKHLRRYGDEAHRLGMKVYLWNHQINNPPPELIRPGLPDSPGTHRLNLDDPRLWIGLDDRYERVCAKLGDSFDGIVLSLTESEFQVHRDNVRATDMTQSETIAKVINTVRAPLARHGKTLIVRDFFRTMDEMNAFRQALDTVPDDVWVYTKCVPNDWQYKYPPHPLLGKVAPHKQIMELDVFTETAGNRGMFMPAPEYYQRQLQLARDRGLAGAIARVDDGYRTNEGTPARFNVFAYSRLLHDPDADTEAMWTEWFTDFYGPEAAPVAIDVLKEMFEVVCAVRYTLGFWTGDHRASLSYADGHLIRNSSAHWSDDPKYASIEKLLIESGPEAIRQAVAEKRRARETAERCLASLDDAIDRFDPAQYTQLRRCFLRAEHNARLGELWVRTWLALRWYRNTKTDAARAELDAAVAACRDFIATTDDRDESPERLPTFLNEVENALRATGTAPE